jgi:hypothetical protein
MAASNEEFVKHVYIKKRVIASCILAFALVMTCAKNKTGYNKHYSVYSFVVYSTMLPVLKLNNIRYVI